MTLAQFLAQRPSGPLYHYTNANGLIGILDRKELWASNVMHLNDAQEFRQGIQMLLGRLEDRLKRYEMGPHSRYWKELYEEWRTSKLNSWGRMHVISFSANGDQLSQWRAYCGGGNGFSIGFGLSDLSHALSVSSFRLVKCVYKPDEQGLLAQALLNYMDQLLARADRLEGCKYFSLMGRASDKLAAGLLAMKHEGFQEEDEWRLIGQSSEAVALRFRPGRFGIIPYCALPLCSESNRPTVHSVYIGPTSDPEVAREALEDLLEARTQEAKDRESTIRQSSIPFRY